MAKYRKLGRTSAQRKALLRNQVTAVINNGKIVTTEAKAKEVQKIVDGLIALAVKEKDNFETVKVTTKVARKDKDGKRVKQIVDKETGKVLAESHRDKDGKLVKIENGVTVTVYDEVEKEIKKVLSGPGDDGYGPLAVMCQYRYHVMRALDVPAACFNPPPKVDSSFMVLEKLEQPRVNVGDEEIFTRLVRSAFAMRRKTLLNNLVSGFSLNREQAAACLAAANLSAQARAEELSLEDFAGLAIQLQNAIR